MAGIPKVGPHVAKFSLDEKAGAEKTLSLVDDTETKSRYGDEYILVRKQNGSSKEPIPIQPLLNVVSGSSLKDVTSRKLNALLKSGLKRGANGPSVRTTLFVTGSVASGAGAALAGFFALKPSASGEHANYDVLYDEVKVHGVRMKYAAIQSVISANPGTSFAIGYDPTIGSTPSSVQSVRESTQSVWGIQKLQALVSGLNSMTTIGDNCKRGTEMFDMKMPTSPVSTDPVNSSTNFPGSWMAALDSQDSVGYIRYYFTAPGGTNVTTLSYLLEMDVSYRIRT